MGFSDRLRGFRRTVPSTSSFSLCNICPTVSTYITLDRLIRSHLDNRALRRTIRIDGASVAAITVLRVARTNHRVDSRRLGRGPTMRRR